MKLLVTGGAGYIGSVVTAQLLGRGHEVTVLDDLSTGHRDAVPDGATFVQGSLHDAAGVLDPTFDAVLHFAAKSLVAESVAHPERYWHGNIAATLTLLDAMRFAQVRRIVFSSTAAVYGAPEQMPITEDQTPAPTNPYGVSKYTIDRMLEAEAAAHGLGAISLRYFNVAGACGDFGERHDPETHLIPNLLAVAVGRLPSAQVFGTDYPTRDGTAVRDYLHVSDLADAHVRAVQRVRLGAHRVYNLGSGTGYTVSEVLAAVRRVTGHPIPTVHAPRRAGDPPVLVASSQRARDELGWAVRHDIEAMVRDAWTFTSTRQVTAP
jgi:UDP-glucose 4-epimerase